MLKATQRSLNSPNLPILKLRRETEAQGCQSWYQFKIFDVANQDLHRTASSWTISPFGARDQQPVQLFELDRLLSNGAQSLRTYCKDGARIRRVLRFRFYQADQDDLENAGSALPNILRFLALVESSFTEKIRLIRKLVLQALKTSEIELLNQYVFFWNSFQATLIEFEDSFQRALLGFN